MSAGLHIPLGGTAPSIPPACPALRPLVRMVAESIDQIGARATAALCFSIGEGFENAALDMRLRGQPAGPVVSADDLDAMAAWLWLRSLDLSGSVQ